MFGFLNWRNKRVSIRFFLSFGAIIIFMIAIGGFAVMQMQALSTLTVKMYDHPLTVSNAVRNAYINILKIHCYMTDVIAAQTVEEINQSIENVDLYEEKVFKNLAIVKNQFLGNKKDIEILIQTFKDWKSIRDEIIVLTKAGQLIEAANLAKDKGFGHVEKLQTQIDYVMDFANNKADNFLANANQKSEEASFFVLLALAIVAVLATWIAILMSYSITKPLNTAVKVADAISKGQLNSEIKVKTQDELGQLLTSFSQMQTILHQIISQDLNRVVKAASEGNLQERINEEGKEGVYKDFSESINRFMETNQRILEETMQVFASLADGNVTQSIKQDYEGAFAQLKTDANTTIYKLTEIVSAIIRASVEVNRAAQQLAESNVNFSQRIEQQAASLEETAASMEEMTSTVQQNADNASHARQLARDARKRAEKGGETIDANIISMNEISKSSKKIKDIISVIDEIAFQTNLLALNAAVEAARAGDQGRGFAVVATEVRNLAQRSATAAKEIKTLIQDSVAQVEEGTLLANQSGDTLQEIIEAVKKVSDIVNEIATASVQQSASIQQVNKAVTQMDGMTQQNAAMLEEATAASEVMKGQAEILRDKTLFFNTGEDISQETESTSTKHDLRMPKRSEDRISQGFKNDDSDEWKDF